MLRRGINKMKARVKFWKQMGFGFQYENQLFKRHSLNCGCGICKINTFYKKYRHKQERIKVRSNIKKYEECNRDMYSS